MKAYTIGEIAQTWKAEHDNGLPKTEFILVSTLDVDALELRIRRLQAKVDSMVMALRERSQSVRRFADRLHDDFRYYGRGEGE